MCLVAETSDTHTVVGCCTVCMLAPEAILPPPFPTTSRVQFYVSNIAVVPDARRQGAGTALLHRAESIAARWGMGSVWLHVDDTNEVATNMYLRRGYKPVKGALADPTSRKAASTSTSTSTSTTTITRRHRRRSSSSLSPWARVREEVGDYMLSVWKGGRRTLLTKSVNGARWRAVYRRAERGARAARAAQRVEMGQVGGSVGADEGMVEERGVEEKPSLGVEVVGGRRGAGGSVGKPSTFVWDAEVAEVMWAKEQEGPTTRTDASRDGS